MIAGGREISSPFVRWFYKRLFPTFWFGLLGLSVVVILMLSNTPNGIPWFVVLHPIIMAFIGYGVLRWMVFDAVDEVRDYGDALSARRGSQEVYVPLSAIERVDGSWITSPERVTLHLGQPTALGTKIVFFPPMRLVTFGVHPLVKELRERLHVARVGKTGISGE